MPHTDVCTYAIYVTLPKGVTVSSGVPGTNGETIVTITASSLTRKRGRPRRWSTGR